VHVNDPGFELFEDLVCWNIVGIVRDLDQPSLVDAIIVSAFGFSDLKRN